MVVIARTPNSVNLIRVIEVKAARGAGSEEDPVRIVTQLWSLDGRLLAEDDPNDNYAPSPERNEQ